MACWVFFNISLYLFSNRWLTHLCTQIHLKVKCRPKPNICQTTVIFPLRPPLLRFQRIWNSSPSIILGEMLASNSSCISQDIYRDTDILALQMLQHYKDNLLMYKNVALQSMFYAFWTTDNISYHISHIAKE